MKKTFVAGVLLALSPCVLADVMYLTATDPRGGSKTETTYSFSSGRAAYEWADGKEPHIEHDYIVCSNFQLNAGSQASYSKRNIFGGKSLQLGEDRDGSSGKANFMLWGTDYDEIADFRWVNGEVWANNEGGVNFYGKMTLSCASRTHVAASKSSSSGKVRSLSFRNKLVCADPALALSVTSGKATGYSANDRTAIGMLQLDDDAANGQYVDTTGFLAKFKVTNPGAYLVFAGANSIHDFGELVSDAVTLQDGAGLVMRPTAVQNANFGVTVESGKTAYLEMFSDDTEVDFCLPVTAAEGTTLVRAGYILDTEAEHAAQTLTLKNDWSAFQGTLVLSNGITVATADAKGLKSVPIVVRAGASFAAPAVASYNVTCDPGGTLMNAPIEVPFDGSVATPVEFPEGLVLEEGIVQPIRLSRPIPLPLNETNRIAVLKITGGTLRPEDFEDLTDKAAMNLPTSWMETETEGGVETVYIVARPAVAFTGGADNKSANLMTAANWSDRKAPHAGSDAYWLFGAPDSATGHMRDSGGSWSAGVTMLSESLTLQGKYMQVYSECFTPKELRLCADSGVYFYNAARDSGAYPCRLRGACVIDESATSDHPVTFYMAGAACSNGYVEANLSGSGVVKFYGCANAKFDEPRHLYLYGDNSAFSGQMQMIRSSANTAVDIVVTNANAFGGSPNRPMNNGVLLNPGSIRSLSLRVDRSMTVDDPQRGWYVNSANFRISEDVVFALKSPLESTYMPFTKDGPGVLALGKVTGNNQTLTVDAGFIGALEPNTFETLKLELADGTGIAADASAVGTLAGTGLTVPAGYLTVAGSTLKATVFNAEAKKASRVSFSTVLCTLPTSLNLSFTPAPMRGWTGSVTSEEVDGGLTRYTITYEPNGLMIFIR